MNQASTNDKPYDLEERTYQFAKAVRLLMQEHVWPPVSWSDVNQLLRSSGSVAANYLEAIEFISPSDNLYRHRLCKKEARESALWMRLIDDCNQLPEQLRKALAELQDESTQLVRIFATIIRNKEANLKLSDQ